MKNDGFSQIISPVMYWEITPRLVQTATLHANILCEYGTTAFVEHAFFGSKQPHDLRDNRLKEPCDLALER